MIGGTIRGIAAPFNDSAQGGLFQMLSPWMSATELHELVPKKEVRPREVADFLIARIEKLNPRIGAS